MAIRHVRERVTRAAHGYVSRIVFLHYFYYYYYYYCYFVFRPSGSPLKSTVAAPPANPFRSEEAAAKVFRRLKYNTGARITLRPQRTAMKTGFGPGSFGRLFSRGDQCEKRVLVPRVIRWRPHTRVEDDRVVSNAREKRTNRTWTRYSSPRWRRFNSATRLSMCAAILRPLATQKWWPVTAVQDVHACSVDIGRRRRPSAKYNVRATVIVVEILFD